MNRSTPDNRIRQISRVLVSHDRRVSYVCEAVEFGYLCGNCRTPLPKMPPEIGDRCHKCKATVTEVLWV